MNDETRQILDRLIKLETQFSTLASTFADFRSTQLETLSETRKTNGRVTTAEKNIIDLSHTITMLGEIQNKHSTQLDKLTDLIEINRSANRDQTEAINNLARTIKDNEDTKHNWTNRLWNTVWASGTMVLLYVLYVTGILNPPRL